jgi:SulP family sulfate permease
MIALFDAQRAGLLQRDHWKANILSGIVVGVVALPLAMAFAIASGAKPEQGIYTAIVAGLVVSVTGGSRVQIAGPTGAFIVILAGITAQYGISGLQLATMMAGVILLLLGMTRMGAVIKFIPAPVIVGFTAGIGVIIWVSQWKDFFGLPAIDGAYFHEKLWHLAQVLLFGTRLPYLKHVPGPLVALVLATLLQAVVQFDGLATIGSAFGGIPQGLPSWHWPEITAARVIELIGPAFAIAMLGSIESLLSAVVADGMAGTRHDSNQELIGQGLANIAAPLFGGFAATGALARTAINICNGGNSPLAGIVHAITLLAIVLLLAPLAVHVPLAVLAAILFVVAWNMSDLPHVIKMIQRAPRADVLILLVTFTLTVFADLVAAVNIGVILATMHFMRRMAASVDVLPMSEQELQQELMHQGFSKLPPGVLVFSIEGPLFFGAVENVERALDITHTMPDVLIFRLRWVPFIDITGLQTLEDVIADLHQRGVRVMLTDANRRVEAKLIKAHIVELVGRINVHATLGSALAACDGVSDAAEKAEKAEKAKADVALIKDKDTDKDKERR